MRLDKFIAENTELTRSQATKALRSGLISVNGTIQKSGATQVTEPDQIMFDDELLPWVEENLYFMFHKPVDVVCDHDDANYPSVCQFFAPPYLTQTPL